MQSRRHSLFEAALNTASGFVISIIAGELIFPAMGLPVSHEQNLLIVSFFTVISIARSYAWRRGFNWWHLRGQLKVYCVRYPTPENELNAIRARMQTNGEHYKHPLAKSILIRECVRLFANLTKNKNVKLLLAGATGKLEYLGPENLWRFYFQIPGEIKMQVDVDLHDSLNAFSAKAETEIKHRQLARASMHGDG